MTDIENADFTMDLAVEPARIELSSNVFPDEQGAAVEGYVDGLGRYELVDLDGDRRPDLLSFDTDGDGRTDLEVLRDGDSYTVTVDADYDGVPDASAEYSAKELADRLPDLWHAVDQAFGRDTEPDENAIQEVSLDDREIHGDPFVLHDNWFNQTFNGSCLPASVAQIYEEYTGRDVTDLDFVALANSVFADQGGGWLVGPDGTPGLPPEAAVTLLQEAGIPAHLEQMTLDELKDAVDEGPVMVAVDSGEYFEPEAMEDNKMDHAVNVTAVGPLVDAQGRIVPDENGQPVDVVYLSDTGRPDGDVLAVPVDIFMDAWADSGNVAVVCDVSAAEFREANDIEGGANQEAAAAAAGQSGSVVDESWTMLPVVVQQATIIPPHR